MPITETIEFDEASHTYKVDGRVVPSVTQILKEAGLIDDRWFTEESRSRGEIVALATEVDDQGALVADEVPILQPYLGYIEAWRKFKADFGGEIVAIEEAVTSPLGYAGTLDRRISRDGWMYVTEIKTGVPERWHGLQLAGYEACEYAGWKYTTKRLGVYLKPDGKYKPVPYKDDSERYVWAGLVAAHNWKAAG